jgi:hypothetical protein
MFKAPYTDMAELQEIQTRFSPSVLSPVASSEYAQNSGVYLLSNDSKLAENYWPTLEPCFILPVPALFTLLYTERRHKQQKKKVALVVGNGNIISLLDQLPVEAVLLLDIEPALHCFVWYVRSLVLAVEEIKNFEEVRAELIQKMADFCYEEKGSANRKPLINKEIKYVGQLHFLANEKRFRSCQKALKTKPLLPVNIDIFDSEQMEDFSSLLQKNMKVNFINFTNVADYDYHRALEHSLRKLPVTQCCKIVFTSLCRSTQYDCDPSLSSNKTFVCDGLEDFLNKISYTYKRCRRYKKKG